MSLGVDSLGVVPLGDDGEEAVSGVTGTAAVTEAADTAAASGTITHLGTAAVTGSGDTAAAIGYMSHLGTAAVTEGADVAAAIGTVGSGEVIGTAAITEAGDIAAASGYLSHLATAAITEGADVAAASGTAGDPLHGFTQDQLDFLVSYMEANMSIPTASEIAAAVRTEIAVELARISDLAKREGLVAGTAVTIPPADGSIVAGDIEVAITTGGDGTVTLARV